MSSATVLQFPRTYRELCPCGCFADMIPEPERFEWVRWPSTYTGAGSILVDADVGRVIAERKWAVIDGLRCYARRENPECPHFIQVFFDEGAWTRGQFE